MSSTIQVKRRLTGISGAPAAGVEGELALNFSAGAGKTPELWANGGAALGWLQVNPATPVTVGSIALPLSAGGTAGSSAGIGAAWTAFATKPTTSLVVASYGGTAYIKTGTGGNDADWTALGAATSFATAAEVATGTNASKAISPALLRGAAVNVPTGGAGPVAGDLNKIVSLNGSGQIADMFIPKLVSTDGTVLQTGVAVNAFLTAAGLRAATVNLSAGTGDHDKIPRLNASGKLDPSFMPANATRLAGTIDPTATALPTPAPVAGNMYFTSKAGAVNAIYTGIPAGTTAAVGDTMIYDGAKWYLLAETTDLSAYVPLAGTALMAGNIVWAGANTVKAGATIINGKGGTIDLVVIDGGTF